MFNVTHNARCEPRCKAGRIGNARSNVRCNVRCGYRFRESEAKTLKTSHSLILLFSNAIFSSPTQGIVSSSSSSSIQVCKIKGSTMSSPQQDSTDHTSEEEEIPTPRPRQLPYPMLPHEFPEAGDWLTMQAYVYRLHQQQMKQLKDVKEELIDLIHKMMHLLAHQGEVIYEQHDRIGVLHGQVAELRVMLARAEGHPAGRREPWMAASLAQAAHHRND